MKKALSILILLCFLVTSIMGPNPVLAQDIRLPAPGVMVHLSPEFNPPILKGIKVHPDNPFRFDFILDLGDESSSPSGGDSFPHVIPTSSIVIPGSSAVIPAKAGIQNQEQLKQEATRLIKYFLASLTIPEKDLWVNLSPYEKDRIVPNSFGLTEMGRDLLAEDYMLKQITASLIYPEDEVGKKFWKRIYEEASKKFGTTNIPVNTFNKVWIIPEKAVVYENAKAGTAYVVESKLKVMLEQDYLALEKNTVIPAKAGIQNKNDINALGSQIVRQIVIPELTKEVNENKNFAQLRQVYNSLILAVWYKKKIKDSILAQVYADKNKTAGVQYTFTVIPKSYAVIPAKAGIQNRINSDMDPRFRGDDKKKDDVNLIYQRYLQAFKKGVYNYIKEEAIPISGMPSKEQGIFPRKYFSGGENFTDMAMNPALNITENFKLPFTSEGQLLAQVRIDATPDTAMLATKQQTGLQLRIQRGITKWRNLDEYSQAFDVDLREVIKEIIAKVKIEQIAGKEKERKVIFADVGMGMGIALNEAVREFSPNLMGVGVDPVDWNGKNDDLNRTKEGVKGLEEYLERKRLDLKDIFEKKNITFIQSDARSVRFTNPPDIITSYNVLQYDEDPIKAYEHLFNQLNNGGIMMVYFAFSKHGETLETYLNMLDYLRRKALIKWTYEYDLLTNHINLYIIARKRNQNIDINAKRLDVEDKFMLVKGRNIAFKSVQYFYEPHLVPDNGDPSFYLDKFLMIAVEKALESVRLPSTKILNFYRHKQTIIINYEGVVISGDKLKDQVSEIVKALFIKNNLKPPHFQIYEEFQSKSIKNFIGLRIRDSVQLAIGEKRRIDDKGEKILNKMDRAMNGKAEDQQTIRDSAPLVPELKPWEPMDIDTPKELSDDQAVKYFEGIIIRPEMANKKAIGLLRMNVINSNVLMAIDFNAVFHSQLIVRALKNGYSGEAYKREWITLDLGWDEKGKLNLVSLLSPIIKDPNKEYSSPMLKFLKLSKDIVPSDFNKIHYEKDIRKELIMISRLIRKAAIEKGIDRNKVEMIFPIYNMFIKDFKGRPRASLDEIADLGIDSAMKASHAGGIDLTSANMNLQTKMDSRRTTVSVGQYDVRGNDISDGGNDNEGSGDDKGGIKFHLDPAMLQQLQNAPGFVPVIINVQPLNDLKSFLGIDDLDSR